MTATAAYSTKPCCPALRQCLARAAAQGVTEVCFKELYVSALSENSWAQSRENAYCQTHQVPLAMATAALEGLGFEVAARLPWGSPVYGGTLGGHGMRVAAYTEPSVGFERATGQARSWNFLADGTCLASLEDPGNRIGMTPGDLLEESDLSVSAVVPAAATC